MVLSENSLWMDNIIDPGLILMYVQPDKLIVAQSLLI